MRAASCGELNHRAKLSDEDVRELRRRRATGVELKVLAKDYGISVSNVHQIVSRMTWRHIP